MRQASQQIRQAIFHSQIFAVASGVLADQIHFANTLPEQSRGFRHHRFEPPAPESPPILRDGAERTRMIATFGDFHVSEVFRCGENTRRFVAIKIRNQRRGSGFNAFARGHNAIQFIGANQRIHFRQLLFDLAPVALHHATGHHQTLRPPELLVLRHLQNRVDGFLLCRVNKRAGIDDNHVRFIGTGCQFMPAFGQPAHHHLAIDKVFRAA